MPFLYMNFFLDMPHVKPFSERGDVKRNTALGVVFVLLGVVVALIIVIFKIKKVRE